MTPVHINYVAVIVAALISMVAGAIWYSQPVFGKKWTKLNGRSMNDIQGGAATGYVFTTIGSLIMAYVLAHFVDYAQAQTFSQGMLTGFWAWIGFVAPAMGAEAVFAGRSRDLYLINVGYQLVALVLMGGVLARWV